MAKIVFKGLIFYKGIENGWIQTKDQPGPK